MNASDLSKKVGISKSTISDWLAGSSPKNIIQVKAVADFFDCSIEFLCFSESEKDQSPINQYNDEINAGIFEVVLRRVKK